MPDLALPEGLQLRPATRADGPALLALVTAVLAEHGLAADPGGTDADLQDVEKNYLRSGGWFVVVVNAAGEIVGSVGLAPLAEPGVVELRKMYLRPELRGRGVGRRLLLEAIAVARARGYRCIRLETASVLKAAVALYLRHGFVPVTDGVHSARCDAAFELTL
jgi:putative acetyltransferase